ncbi:hypothetical protein [Glaciibacter superstes]|uniref:hypothetical protein n=1 Tax=Glaciibacter superstes TaxID=501023 RepID=UPI0003B4DA36|nr:hypothetical protein [Glaciibacter superstes]
MSDEQREAAQAEANQRYPRNQIVDDPFSPTGEAQSDPYGYEEHANEAFVAGVEWQAAKAEPVTIDREALIEFIADFQACGSCAGESWCKACQEEANAIIAHLAAQPVTPEPNTIIAPSDLADAHARWHAQSGNLIYDGCEWERCEFWAIGKFLIDQGAQPVTGAVTDDMVERAARVMFEPPSISDGEYTWDEMVREDPSRADMWRGDARAALAAALGGGSRS